MSAANRPVAVSRNLLEHLAWTHRDEAVIEFNTDTAFLAVDGITFHSALTDDPDPLSEQNWVEDLARVLTEHGTGIAAAAEAIANGAMPSREPDCYGRDPWHGIPADADQLADLAANDEWWRMVTGGDAA